MVWLVGVLVVMVGCAGAERAEKQQIEVLEVVDEARALIEEEQSTEAFALVEEAWKQGHWETDFARTNYYQFMMWAESFEHNHDRSELYYDSMYRVDKHHTDIYPRQYAHNLITRADVYLKKQEFNRAFECLYMAKRIADEYQDHQTLFRLYSILGNAMYRQRNFKEAALNYREGYWNAKKVLLKQNRNKYKDVNGQANNAALSFLRLGLYDSAQYYYDRAMESMDSFAQFNPNDHLFLMHGTGNVLSNIAHLELKKGNVELALELHRSSIDYNIDSGGVEIEGLVTVCQVSEIYVQLNDLDQAKALLKKYEERMDSFPGGYLQGALEKAWWKYQLARGDTAQAYVHYLKFKEHTNVDKLKSRNFVDIDFENEMAKYEDMWSLRKLKEKSKLLQTVLIISLAFLLTFLLLSWVIRRNNKKLKALNSEVKKQNERLSLSIKSLEESQDENRKIMRVVAHDLRSPIGGFAGLAELLLEKDYYEEEDRELIELIHTSSNEALGFVNELLQINHDDTEMKKEPTDLVLVLEQSVMLQRHKAVAKGIALEVKEEEVIADVNREKMGRVMSNIIGNAIKFSHDNSQIEIDLSKGKKGALFSVKDQGIGIPKDMQPKLFEIGKEKQRLGTQGEASHGLGMIITKQLVEAHNGKIWLESEEGKGTKFFVEIPF